MSERLDRLEAIVESNTLAVQALSQRTADNANAIKVLTEHQAQYSEQLRSEVTNLAELIHVLSQQHGDTIARIDVMQSEVRGLQVETRRILERWDNGN